MHEPLRQPLVNNTDEAEGTPGATVHQPRYGAVVHLPLGRWPAQSGALSRVHRETASIDKKILKSILAMCIVLGFATGGIELAVALDKGNPFGIVTLSAPFVLLACYWCKLLTTQCCDQLDAREARTAAVPYVDLSQLEAGQRIVDTTPNAPQNDGITMPRARR